MPLGHGLERYICISIWDALLGCLFGGCDFKCSCNTLLVSAADFGRLGDHIALAGWNGLWAILTAPFPMLAN